MRTTTPLRATAICFAMALTTTACSGDDSTDDAASSDGPSTTGDGTTGTSSTTSSTSTTDSTGSTSDGSTTTGDPSTTTDGSTGSTGGTDASTGEQQLEIVGDWIETYDGGTIEHTITPTVWSQDADFGSFGYLLEDFDNAARWVVGQSDPNNGGDGTYSRFDWTYDPQDTLYYCTAAFSQPSAQDAIDAPPADPGNLDAGCGGFSWSALQPN